MRNLIVLFLMACLSSVMATPLSLKPTVAITVTGASDVDVGINVSPQEAFIYSKVTSSESLLNLSNSVSTTVFAYNDATAKTKFVLWNPVTKKVEVVILGKTLTGRTAIILYKNLGVHTLIADLTYFKLSGTEVRCS